MSLDRGGSSTPAGVSGTETTTFSPPTTSANLDTYEYTYTVSGGGACPSGGCTIEVSSNGWYSCATVNIISASQGACMLSRSSPGWAGGAHFNADGHRYACRCVRVRVCVRACVCVCARASVHALCGFSPLASQNLAVSTSCHIATGLSFCSMMNGQNVVIANGASMAQLDTQAQTAYNDNLPNTNVFANGANSDCQTAYKNLLCFNTFPLCGTSMGVCQDACSQVTSKCGLQPQHANLYQCSSYPTSSCTNQAALAPTCCTPGQGIGIFLLVVLLASIVGFVGAMVYWRRNDRGRYDAIMAKPGQWYDSAKNRFSH